MKELSILCNTEMVMALLAGKKTMTRRTIKQKSGICMFCGCTENNCKVCIEKTGNPCYWVNDEKTICSACNDLKNTNKSKYQKGDFLWVKESYYAYGRWVKNGFTKKGKQKFKFLDLTIERKHNYLYEDCAPNKVLGLGLAKIDGIVGWFNRPSLFMPKSAARIWLKVTGVKVERLQDISKEDAIAEGVKEIWGLGYKHYTAKKRFTKEELKDGCLYLNSPILSFLTLWESIYGDESLKENLWVFAYSFEVISTTGAPVKTADNEKSNG